MTTRVTTHPERFSFDTPQIPMVSLIDSDGNAVKDPDFSWAPDSTPLVSLLENMATIRRFDLEATALQRKGELGLWAPLLGQEAIQVGVHAALADGDHVFPSHREHGLGMLMGVPIERMLAIFRGYEMSDWDANDYGFHHYSMVIGAHTLHGVGYAMAQAADGDPGVTLVFHGDGAISEGDVNEAYVFAASYNAPVVFICVNNQWAISEPVSLQSRIPLYQRAWGFGIPSLRVDGNDVVAVHAVVSAAIERARAGEGPSMIEAFTYRMGAHTTSDDPTKYRTGDEEHAWESRDPIARVATYLRSQGQWDDVQQADLEQRMESFGEEVRDKVNHLHEPRMADIFDNVYVEKTPRLVVQQHAFGGLK